MYWSEEWAWIHNILECKVSSLYNIIQIVYPFSSTKELSGFELIWHMHGIIHNGFATDSAVFWKNSNKNGVYLFKKSYFSNEWRLLLDQNLSQLCLCVNFHCYVFWTSSCAKKKSYEKNNRSIDINENNADDRHDIVICVLIQKDVTNLLFSRLTASSIVSGKAEWFVSGKTSIRPETTMETAEIA